MKRIDEIDDTWEQTNPFVLREKVNEVIRSINILIDTVNLRQCVPKSYSSAEREAMREAVVEQLVSVKKDSL
jgi:hypothetical protein